MHYFFVKKIEMIKHPNQYYRTNKNIIKALAGLLLRGLFADLAQTTSLNIIALSGTRGPVDCTTEFLNKILRRQVVFFNIEVEEGNVCILENDVLENSSHEMASTIRFRNKAIHIHCFGTRL